MKFLVVLVCVSLSLPAQTTGFPGVNDLRMNGVGSGTTSCFTSFVNAGPRTINFSIDGAPNSIVLIAAGVCQPGAAPLGPAGTLDLSLVSLTIILDGTAGTPGPFLLPWTVTNSAGLWSLGIAVNMPAGPVGSIQGLLLNAAFPVGFAVTQAGSLFGLSLGALPLCPTTIGMDLSPITEDGNVPIALSSPFTFYGVSYNTVFVNMNGNVTFVAPNPDFSPSQADFLGSQPRIAGVWDDWSPQDPAQGTVRARQTASSLAVEWFDVRHYGLVDCGLGASGFQDSNTFCIELDYASGNITIRHGVMTLCSGSATPSTDQLVGISPGFGSSAVNNVDLSAGLAVAPSAGSALYEDFGLAIFGAFDLGSTWGAVSGLTFTGNGAGAGPYTSTPF